MNVPEIEEKFATAKPGDVVIVETTRDWHDDEWAMLRELFDKLAKDADVHFVLLDGRHSHLVRIDTRETKDVQAEAQAAVHEPEGTDGPVDPPQS